MAASTNLEEALKEFLSETKATEQRHKLVQFLRVYLACRVDNPSTSTLITSSDPHTVLDILVQRLLSSFTSIFVDNAPPTSSGNISPSLERNDLQQFLREEENLLLLATIQHLSMQVDSSHLGIVELLLVVLRTLVGDAAILTVEEDLYLNITPIYASSRPSTKREVTVKSTNNKPWSLTARSHSCTAVPALGPQVSEWISETFVKFQSLSSGITDEYLYLLITAIIEGLTHKYQPKNNSQLVSCIETITNMGLLLEDLLDLWLRVRTDHPINSSVDDVAESASQPTGYLSTSLLYRAVLRVWLNLFQNTLLSLTSSSHINELQGLLSLPIAMVTTHSLSLNKDWLFIGRRSLDIEFSFTFLESLFASISVTNFFNSSSHVTADNFLKAVQGILSSESQDLLVYLCSKLQSLPRQSAVFESILSSIHILLCLLAREMITLSDHIHACRDMAKSHLLQLDSSTASAGYSLERSLEFDKIEQRLCKISQSLLTIFDNVPSIQLLSLQLLAQTGLDKVGIINDFLPRVSHSSVWSMPEVLDLYLELLEKAWFQLSPEYAGSADFWSKVSHYATPLIQKGSNDTVTQVIYHLLFLLSHGSNYLKSALTQYVILEHHPKMIEGFQHKAYNGNELNKDICWKMDEEKVYRQYLKLLQKMATHPSSLVPFFIDNPNNIFLLFLFVPITKFRADVLEVFKIILTTLSSPWEASILHASKLSDSKVHYHLVNSLLRISYEFNRGQVANLCVQLSSSGLSTGHVDLRHVDRIHKTIQDLLEHSDIPLLLTPAVVYDLQLVTDVWAVLSVTVETCTSLLQILHNNQIWDVIHVLSLSSASLLGRLQEWHQGTKQGDEERPLGGPEEPGEPGPLQETLVGLHCNLMAMAMNMSRLKDASLKVLELHCREVHSYLTGSRLCSISNSSEFIATLMKAVGFFSPESEPVHPSFTSRKHSSSTAITSDKHTSAPATKLPPIVVYKQSRIRPVSLSAEKKMRSKNLFLRQNTFPLLKSPVTGLKQLYPLSSDLIDGDTSDASGYEGDTEFWTQRWWEGEQRYEQEEENEEDLVAGTGGSITRLNSLAQIRAPVEMRRKIWSEVPIWQSIELLKECLEDRDTAEKCEPSLELFLTYLLSLLKADKFNLGLLAGKSILGNLLESFALIFDSQTEKSKSCWLILCQVTELLATYQISKSDIQYLFLKLQKSPTHLEQLSLILHKVAETTRSSKQPSAYLEFGYNRPTPELDVSKMLILPNPQINGLDPCTMSLWLCVNKYPLQAYLHLFSIYTGTVYFQVWACACSGDIIFNLSSEVLTTCADIPSPTVSTVTVGTALIPNSFHHLFLTITTVHVRSKQQPYQDFWQYKVLLVIDGTDVYEYLVDLPHKLSKSKDPEKDSIKTEVYVAGGVVSSHTQEKHIHLMNADHTQLLWRLGSIHVFEGFSSITMSNLLYQLGPECSPSTIQSPDSNNGLVTSYIEVTSKETTYVNQGPLSDMELVALQCPIISYTPHNARMVYLMSIKELPNEDIDQDHSQLVRIPSVHSLEWINGNLVSRPQILDVLQDCTGLEQLVYLYAKIVSEGCSDQAHCAALSLIHLAVVHSPYSKLQFKQIGGIKLIQQVLRSSKATLTMDVANVFFNWCSGSEWLEIYDTEILEYILLDWHIWYKAPEQVWCNLLKHLQDLLNPTNRHSEVNLVHFLSVNAIVKILSISKEQSLFSNREPLSSKIVMMLAHLVKLLIGDPPILDNLKYVWDHLLLPDLNKCNILRDGDNLDSTVSFVDTSRLFSSSGDGRKSSVISVNAMGIQMENHFDQTSNDFTNNGHDSEYDSEPEMLDMMEFDVQAKEGRLPGSSYAEEEVLFTWTDITGLPFLSDKPMNNGFNLETGLLSVIRKIIFLLPDTKVRQVLGPILDQEDIVVMANNSSVLVRTAVVRLLDGFFQRAGESSQANFLQVKGFNLLGLQLKQYPISSELMSALFSIVLGQEVNLQNDISGNIQIPRDPTKFQLHAVNPILMSAVNTISHPTLCHSTLCLLRELFEMTKRMPMFMINNGLFKMLIQMIALLPETTSTLQKDQRQLILNDLLGFCKLLVIFTLRCDILIELSEQTPIILIMRNYMCTSLPHYVFIISPSSDQDDMFRSLESFIACLRHCSNEVVKSKGPQCLTVVYLELFIYLVLAEALLFFSSGEVNGGTVRGVPAFTPTLESCQQQVATATELNNRFALVCTMTVDWIIHGIEPMTENHAQLFKEGCTIPKFITYDKKAQLVTKTAGFVRFTMHYFYRALLIVIKKNTAISFDPSPHRFFINSRVQLNDAFSRLFGYLLSPLHSPQMRAEVLKEVWSLGECSELLHNLFMSSQYKKLLCSRIIVAAVDLIVSSNVRVEHSLVHACSGIYEVVCASGATKLKSNSSFSSLTEIKEDEGSRTKQTMDDLRSCDHRWSERVEMGQKDFNHHLKTLYRKLIEKTRNLERAVSSASSQMTDRVFNRQAQLRKSFLLQFEHCGMNEKKSLQEWKEIIQKNTHPRALWSDDECRPMCWQLDPTEGPSRVRRRLVRSPRTIDEKFLLEQTKATDSSSIAQSPLSFIFEKTPYDGATGLFTSIVRHEKDEIRIGTYSAKSISPDGCCSGNLILSTILCYFLGNEPLADPNVAKVVPGDDETQLFSWRHADVVEIHRRRYMLKDNALEIFLINGVTNLLAFGSTKERDQVHSALLQRELPSIADQGDADTGKLKEVTISWQQGEITNFEYLMELNKLAGRTFNDLMQYPVFPFILADYDSPELNLHVKENFRKLDLPISVQDESKQDKYINTYKYLESEMSIHQGSAVPGVNLSKPYHYGSHYSNSGIVLHFLVRMPPFTSMFLDFQGKSFDIADRSFHNIKTTWWLSSSESATDVKELIPEFYYFPEFLVNSERFNFGIKQDGQVVDDVTLPPWSNGDPRLFVLKHRQALESEFVSKHLHEWIDLVFGFKQTGKAAVAAINVFHPATYYGADGIDIDSIQDVTQQEALKAMVKTYGQMPLQLFKEPHPPRSKSTVRTTLLIRFGYALKKLTSSMSNQLRIVDPIVRYYMKVLKPKISGDYEFIGKNQAPPHKTAGTLQTGCSPERISCIASGEVAITGLNAAFFPSQSPNQHSLLVTWGHWDNALVVRSVGGDGPSALKLHHPSLNRISFCQCVCNGQMLVSAGTGGVVSFWELSNSSKSPLQYSGRVHHLRGHDGPITCLVACKPYSVIVSGSTDCTCIIWDINRLCYVNSLPEHEGSISCLAVSSTLGDIATVCLERRRKGYPGATSKPVQKSILTLWTINGKKVKQIKVDVQIMSLCYTSAPEGVYINTLVVGLADGAICLLSSWDLSVVTKLECPWNSPIPVLSLAVSSCSTKLFAGYSNRNIVTWVKPVSNDTDDNGEYVVVPSIQPPAPEFQNGVEKAAKSTATMLEYF